MTTGPTPNPSVPANMAPVIVAGSKITPTPTSSATPNPNQTPSTTVNKSTLTKVPAGINTDWDAFLNGKITYVPAGTAANGVQTEPYVAYGDTAGDVRPTAVVLTATPDGKAYVLTPIDQALRQYLAAIPKSNIKFYKSQLQAYYSSGKAFQNSMQQPVTERDLGFEAAVRKSLLSVSAENFYKAQEFGSWLKDNPSSAKTAASNLFTFDTFVNTRQRPATQTSTNIRQSSLTLRDDAINDFKRTVQQYVGDPALVDNLPALAEAYWNKLHAEELKRVGSSRTVTDPITGNTVGSSTGYSQLTDVDRLEMRINFITNGGSAKNKKGKVQQSLGIKNVDIQQLQDSGGLIGDNYTKLVNHAYEMGIPVNKDELVKRSAKTLLPGGSVDEQQRSMTQAAKVLYKGLASYIDGGGKVSDIAFNFQSKKENELELTKGSVDIFDDYVQKALRSDTLPTDNDYIMSIRKDPNLGWKYTSKANEASAGFLDTLLKTWGKVG